MHLWQDGVIAALAAIGLASLLWISARGVLLAWPERSRRAAALLCAQGDGEHLEQQLRVLGQLRQERDVIGRVLLVDCGLTEEGRKLAKLLARRDRWVTLCGPEDVGAYLTGSIPNPGACR